MFGLSRSRVTSSDRPARSREATSRRPIGYAYCDGGISNQKIALLGLIVAANQGSRPDERTLFLPHICVKDQQNKAMSLARFGEVFCEKTFSDFLRRWTIEAFEEAPERIEMIPEERRVEERGWTYFGKGGGHLGDLSRTPDAAHLGIAADFFRSLVPRLVRSRDFQRTLGKLRKRDVRTATQLRIELDWYLFSETSLKPTIGTREDYCIPAERIVAKIKASLPDAAEAVFVSCDEKFIFASRADITRHVLADTGCAILWKADLLGEAAAAAQTPLHASLFDFELCAAMPNFVGNSRSTFGNLATFERHARFSHRAEGFAPRDFIYNLPGPVLGSRTDHGTQVDPHAACGLPGPPADT